MSSGRSGAGRQFRGGRGDGGGRGSRDGGRGNRDGGRGGRGNRDGGRGNRDSGGGFGRGGGGAAVVPSLDAVLTNVLPAKVVDTFCFYLYSIDATDKKDDLIDSRSRRLELFGLGFWDGHLSGMMSAAEKKELRRMVFFAGSFFYSARAIPGLEPNRLPVMLCNGSTTNGDTMECVDARRFTTPLSLLPPTVAAISLAAGEVAVDGFRCRNCTRTFANENDMLQHCRMTGHGPIYLGTTNDGLDEGMISRPATNEVFISYVSLALERAMGERLTRWGREFVDRDAPIAATDRQGRDLGVSIFEAISLSLGLLKIGNQPPSLTLTCDLKAKVIRNISVLDCIYESRGSQPFTPQEKTRLRQQWIGTVVIYKNDHKCYTVTELVFDHSPDTLPVPSKGMSHTEYFARKGTVLKWPSAKPMVAVEGRQKSTIYLPAELVMGNELEPRVREMLPQIASFKPEFRERAITKVYSFLKPGEQRSSGGSLLPAIGVVLGDQRIVTAAKILPAPVLIVAGVRVPAHNAEHWAPLLGRANFNIDPKQAIQLNVILFYSTKLRSAGVLKVYERIRDLVNGLKSRYRFGVKPYAIVETGEMAKHWGAFEKYFSGTLPANLFVLDFVKPNAATDPAYAVVKHMLAKSGHLSQFVSFKTYQHDEPRDMRKSDMILQGVARQVLQKSGFQIWWTDVPKSLPLPAMFVGVDVFHAPMVYDVKNKKRGRKASVAAIIVTVIRKTSQADQKVEIFSKSFRRSCGKEYELGEPLEETVSEAKRLLKVEPQSVVIWRDGIGESADHHAAEEIKGIRNALKKAPVGTKAGPILDVPLAYIVCQKRIATKLFTRDGKSGAPSGTMVTSLQGMQYQTFYINGRAPPYSTPKPVRFQCVTRDDGLNNVPLAELTWSECHNYPNWAGPVKVPSVCQMAHKLAELAGAFADDGTPLDYAAFKNRVWFL